MELCRAITTFSWSNSISHSSLLTGKISISIRERKIHKFRVSNQSQKENQMTVSVTGATGFIGRRLGQRFHKDNHKIHVLTRSRSRARLIFPAKDSPRIMIAEEPDWKDCFQDQDRDQGKQNQSHLKGVINGTAPNPVRLSEMCDDLGNAMGCPSWLPVPDFALKAVLGEGASLVLEGQKVLPARAKELGFPFKYPHVKDALKAILSEA